jgi:hypothetical protein
MNTNSMWSTPSRDVPEADPTLTNYIVQAWYSSGNARSGRTDRTTQNPYKQLLCRKSLVKSTGLFVPIYIGNL